ncbi:MAG: hypothetical protein ABR968_11140 [Bacteroidales bacterium]|jgi:hypothetical protein
MEEQNVNTTVETKKMPGFLKVLCILSFVGIGLGFISAIYNIFTFQSTIDAMKSLNGLLGGTDLGSSIDALIKYGQIVYIINAVCVIICLIGVLMMWKLKKTGFYIYLVGEIAPAIFSFALLGGFGALGTMAMVMGLIFPIAFIIMYGLNLKHMS